MILLLDFAVQQAQLPENTRSCSNFFFAGAFQCHLDGMWGVIEISMWSLLFLQRKIDWHELAWMTRSGSCMHGYR